MGCVGKEERRGEDWGGGGEGGSGGGETKQSGVWQGGRGWGRGRWGGEGSFTPGFTFHLNIGFWS